jgi:hypothetical protein
LDLLTLLPDGGPDVSAFEKAAIQRLVDQAAAAGVPVPNEVRDALERTGHGGNGGAMAWVVAHPDKEFWPADAFGCCWGSTIQGPENCYCWEPVFEIEQLAPCPPASADDLAARTRMCGDCAFRKGSPERADAFSEEMLMETAATGQPFWCHDGMRRPARWRHPLLGEVEGSPDDWQPPIVNAVPYRADGSPGLLCAGWMARATRAS